MSNKILVIGSSNTDLVLKTERFPKPGETILGGDFFVFQGGKGANQAVAAARLGGQVSFICKVGSDAFGQEAIKHYAAEGIDTSGIILDPASPTGVAIITVNAEGENSIIVASGANAKLNVADMRQHSLKISDAEWIIIQLETPLEVIKDLCTIAKADHKNLILNPAPAQTLPVEIFENLFLITPNETETELLTGITISNLENAKKASEILKSKGVQNVIITLGKQGAYANCTNFEGLVPAFEVEAVDSTAAGDVFNGALVVALSENKSWQEAITFASKAASISVTRMGAQASAPLRNEII